MKTPLIRKPYRSPNLPKYAKVLIHMGDHTTDVVDLGSGEVLYSTLTSRRVLSRTCRWCEYHGYAVLKLTIPNLETP